MRLRAFHERWKSRGAELREFIPVARGISAAESLQYELIHALTEAKGWRLSEAERAEVALLTLPSEAR